jgi:hypothetical protein
MDTRTGRIYGSFDEALEAGVPEEFLVPVPHHAIEIQRECYKTRDMGRSKLQPHQGSREMARRAKRQAA